MKRRTAAWMMILCLVPMRVTGDDMMNDFHYEQYEALYFKMLDQYPEPDSAAFPDYPAAGRALFVVLMFDMEIQNGGLAQFFWNCGASYARLLPDALRTTGLADVADLYDGFLRDHALTPDIIASFRERDPEWGDYYEWYDYNAFDDPYMKIWKETDINQRFIDYSAQHPEIWAVPS